MTIDINVLVFCHPKLINLDGGHWNLDCFIKTIDVFINNTYGNQYDPSQHNVIFKTVDIKRGGNYVGDGFSRDFCTKYQGQFDIVYLPDCGGQWFQLQEDGNYEQFIELLNNITLLINSNGIIWLSKFIYPEFKKIAEQYGSQCGDEKYKEYVCPCGHQIYTPIVVNIN